VVSLSLISGTQRNWRPKRDVERQVRVEHDEDMISGWHFLWHIHSKKMTSDMGFFEHFGPDSER
jgi:hypothetical protein